jgi:hypothetical protein
MNSAADPAVGKKKRFRLLMKWANEHRKLVILLTVFTLVFPVLVGCLGNIYSKHRFVVILAALVGAWPDVNPNTDPGPWVGMGLALSALSVFGIPTILGVAVTLLLERAERNVAMSFLKYLADRDAFITTEVYREFRNKVKDNISNQECRDLARAAVKRAADEWQNTSDEDILETLDDAQVPEPGIEAMSE